MQLRKLGRSGLYVSEMSLGAMTFGGSQGLWGQVGQMGQQDADDLVKAALDAGVNLIDTANIYADGRSEEILGRSLRNLGVARDDIIISTKGGAPTGDGPNMRGGSRRHILQQCHASLRRLGLDNVDLYSIHEFDPATPIEETLEALEVLVRAGDVRYVGLSNWAAWQVMKALGIGRARDLSPVISLQAYYSLAGRDLERDIIPMLESEEVGLMVWSPLAGGYLTGKYAQGSGEGRFKTINFPPVDQERGDKVIAVMTEIARKHDCSASHIALAWLRAQSAVSTIIVGAKTVAQFADNIRALQVVLDEEDMARLDATSALPVEYPGWLINRSR